MSDSRRKHLVSCSLENREAQTCLPFNHLVFFRMAQTLRGVQLELKNMKRSAAKLILVLGFSVVLTTAGSAWALQGCPGLGHTTAHSDALNDAAGLIQDQAHKHNDRIHCPEEEFDKLLMGLASSALRLEPAFGLAAERPDRGHPRDVTTIRSWAKNFEIRPHISPYLLLSRFRI